jgi:hypothetical protein
MELAVATTKDIIRIEATPSTWNLHKYLVVVENKNKTSVQKAIQSIFRKISEPLENQPPNFPFPRCGGRENVQTTEQYTENMENPAETTTETMTAYMTKLKTMALAQNPQDAGPTSPPKRHRKFTISYAGAVKSGIIQQTGMTKTATSDNDADTSEKDKKGTKAMENTSTQRQVSQESQTMDTSRSTESSLSRSLTNSKAQSSKTDIDREIAELKNNLEHRMDRQDQRISELIKVIHSMNQDIEKRMASAVLHTLAYEKSKVEEITHGRNYSAKDAPLANEDGILPCGVKVKAGGPLDRLHHVEITVQHMANVLDTIVEHFSKDPSARYLFNDDHSDDNSETATIIADQNKDDYSITDNDVQMKLTRELSGMKRLHDESGSPARTKNPSDENELSNSSPQKSPPSKREKAVQRTPSAKPDVRNSRERGES